ncbi:hypothetical protein HBI38_049500 [Parastagonospora nodorum]|nr:hypothetical protein HBH49_057740 [Parastagonospora nodorum]KAH4071749.1 hypothetical protein HBH50_068090 [Parastagonospora nodorum]KAH4094633.1 hypothetical protein HBH48_056360 [Parastagonospora nodorum]KAH4415592.1 hypothetical protein HBH92_079830 [Parastagonospora nodorum]KAH4440758.1 hypothetical protein HBH93_081510 [Parastagonospora nodorum]
MHTFWSRGKVIRSALLAAKSRLLGSRKAHPAPSNKTDLTDTLMRACKALQELTWPTKQARQSYERPYRHLDDRLTYTVRAQTRPV